MVLGPITVLNNEMGDNEMPLIWNGVYLEVGFQKSSLRYLVGN